ncbi:MAG: hypothetical protein ACREN1_07615 [Candidatus Dormibacteria bacterium]
MTTSEPREIKPEEWAAIGELPAAAPDLSRVKDRLVAALGASGTVEREAPRPALPALRPTTMKELLLGVLTPTQARRFVEVPAARASIWQAFRLRAQRGSGARL